MSLRREEGKSVQNYNAPTPGMTDLYMGSQLTAGPVILENRVIYKHVLIRFENTSTIFKLAEATLWSRTATYNDDGLSSQGKTSARFLHCKE